ncbi:MAG: hypothetical protein Q9218_006484 [Villophora microphyllina]
MSSASAPNLSQYTPSSTSQSSKPQRVLACVLCQQRKRRRRRRFPERALLDRLAKYEDLLRHNNIPFEPLHKDSAGGKESHQRESGDGSDDEQPVSTPSTTVKSERSHEAKYFRDPENDSDSSNDDIRETVIKRAWDQSAGNEDHLLFGLRSTNVDLSTLHPYPVHIFRLWQIYLDNVDPLLKITHTPSLQGRIIEAASNVTNIDPTLEALVFSIYCTSVLSLSVEDCQTIFGVSQDDLLMRYHFGCQQALLNCGFLRTNDRDCLTALCLYLMSVEPSTVAQSLSSLLGVAIRIAQRMGIHSESILAQCTVLEAEMRRRLWWSLMLFDARIGERTQMKVVTLDPTWDCKIPLNVNDSDLRPEMKVPPTVQTRSEALFAVVRGELGDFVRHTGSHLDFTNPALKPIAKHVQNGLIPGGSELVRLEEMIEGQYLDSLDENNPLHFMTMWSARAYMAKCRLMEHHARFSNSSAGKTEAQRDAATSYAFRMLECDTKILTSPLIKGFRWLIRFYFPFPAYVQIVQDVRRRPNSELARQAWEILSDNYEAVNTSVNKIRDDSPFLRMLAKIFLQAWEACQAAAPQQEMATPRIVLALRQALGQTAGHPSIPAMQQPNTTMMDLQGFDNFLSPTPMPMSMGSTEQTALDHSGAQQDFAGMGTDMYLDMPGEALTHTSMDQVNLDQLDMDQLNMDQVDWTAFNAQLYQENH